MLPKPTYTAALDNGRYTTVEGHFVDVKLSGEGQMEVNDAKVANADVSANNGIIHTIDKVLMPVSGKKKNILRKSSDLYDSMSLKGVFRDSPVNGCE